MPITVKEKIGALAARSLDRIRAHSSLYRRDDTHSLDARGVHISSRV